MYHFANGATRDDHTESKRVSTLKKGGAGTELKKLLILVNILPRRGCGCNAMANEMNRRGEEWCRANLAKIVETMKKEAFARRLPFSSIVARRLVLFAIRRSEKSKLEQAKEKANLAHA